MDLLLIPDYIMDTHGLLDGIESWGESRQLGKRKQHWVPEDAAVSKMAKSNGDQNSWEQVEELAADLDGSCSLSSLNVDLGTSTFQNGDALLSLPSLSALKQELLSPFNNNESCGEISGQTSPQHQKQIQQCYEQGMNGGVDYPVGLNSPVQSDGSNSGSNLVAPSIVPVALVSSNSVNQYAEDCRRGEVNGQTSPQRQKQIQPQCYEQGMNGAVDYQVGLHSPVQSDGSNSGSNPIVPVSLVSSGSVSQFTEDCRFQYVLAAATSIATKVNEETLTYLNQGQSYEIKLKKLGDLSEYRGKILKSVVRLVFHERRLQYMEREQLAAWEASHPGDSILEVDLPLSYGLLELSQDPARLNTIEFLWDPTKEVGVYIKVNCISTEFTPKKHGGEKGVPFRIQVETYLQGDQGVRHLHTASCQVKVFKLKGADRKHKQDREKIQKRPLLEQEKYQCSYDCTILTDVPLNGDNAFPPLLLNGNSTSLSTDMTKLRQALPITKEETSPISQSSPNHSSPCDSPLQFGGGVNASWGPQETGMWLQANRYGAHLHTLASYSGLDLLQLTRENLIQLCGLPDGIRLYNALHPRAVSPRLTLYLSCEAGSRVYHAVYLSVATSRELVAKLASMLGLTLSQVVALYMLGPNNIRVIVSDELVSHISDQSAFAVEILTHDASTDRYQLLLKKTNANPSN